MNFFGKKEEGSEYNRFVDVVIETIGCANDDRKVTRIDRQPRQERGTH